MMKKIASIEAQFIRNLRSIYHAEGLLILALTRMVVAAEAPYLRAGLARHLEQTHHHLRRLDLVFNEIHHLPAGGECPDIAATITETERGLRSLTYGPTLDRLLIGAARKIGCYEIAAYRVIIARATELGYGAIVALLEWNLQEEELCEYHLRNVEAEMNNSREGRGSYLSNGTGAVAS